MLKQATTIFLFIICFTIGYVRETIFLVINTVIHNYPFPYNASYLKPPDFLYQWEKEELSLLKWILTLVFSLLFMGLSVLIINSYFKYKRYNIIVLLIYSFLLLIAFLIVALGLLLNDYDAFYTLSRLIVGLLQSPIFPVFLFIAFYINTYQSKEEL